MFRRALSRTKRRGILLKLALGLALGFSATTTYVHAQEPPERVIFGGDAIYPPFEWLEEGEPSGFNIDLEKAIGRVSNTNVTHRLGAWADILNALEAGEVDVVPMFVSSERQQRFLFTTPFHYINHAIYALPDTPPIYSVSELTQQRVAIEEQSFAERQLVVEKVGAITVPTANTLGALKAVEEGRADYAVLAASTADRLISEDQRPLKRLGPPFWSRGYAFGVSKERPELQAWLQQVLDLAIATGIYQEVYEKWQSELTFSGPDTSTIIRRTAFALSGLGILAALAFCWSWVLRRKVRAQTGDLRLALEQVQASESLAQHFAAFDSETGLAKSHYFSTLVDQALAELSRTSGQKRKEMMLIQLADLDDVVGAFGKTYSEEWTRQFADHLRALSGGLCAYFGRGVFALFSGEEALSLPLSPGKQKSNEQPYAHLVGGSAFFPEDGTTSSELIAKAEIALSVCLSTGKQWVIYESTMEPDPINAAIVSAFRQDPVEGLYSVFQPQIDLRSQKIVAAEALVRWNHPDLGFISPDKFIPLIEKAGLVYKVTAIMLHEAARLSSLLRKLKLPITISVNIAVYDLISTDLPSIVADALSRNKAQPSDLKLELTETSFASDSRSLQSVVDQIRELGVSIAIDDFGTGYSSLSYLSILPIQELKIDRMFVYDMANNERNRNIVRSTILLAQTLGLVSVAEGAEDANTLRILNEYGCDRVQGYVFSKPLAEPELIKFIQEKSQKHLFNGSVI